MAEQYFTHNPSAAHDERVIDYHLEQIDLKFTTDSGVFSKNRVDYGSGVLIKTMKDVAFPAKGILDLGCGYGPIGLFAAKFWPDQTVEMVDVNERSLALAQNNARTNGITNVNIHQSNVYDQLAGKNYGLILTNPPIRAGKQVVSAMLAGANDHLVDGGMILVVIQKKQGEPSARKLLTATFGNCEILARDKGYYILKAVKQA